MPFGFRKGKATRHHDELPQGAQEAHSAAPLAAVSTVPLRMGESSPPTAAVRGKTHDVGESMVSLGAATEIVGFVGAGIGLGMAYFSGPSSIAAVLAEMSVDLSLIGIGAVMRKYAAGIGEKLSRLVKGGKTDRDAVKCRSPLHTIGKVALITSPIELAIGFGISGFSSTLSEAAVLVTALPCMVFAAAGLLHSKLSRSDRPSPKQPRGR